MLDLERVHNQNDEDALRENMTLHESKWGQVRRKIACSVILCRTCCAPNIFAFISLSHVAACVLIALLGPLTWCATQYGILYDDGDREDFVFGKLVLPQEMDGETCNLRDGPTEVVCGFAQNELHRHTEAPAPRQLRIGERIFARWT